MIVSEKQPPFCHYNYWERQPDPFHASAILPALASAGLQAANAASLDHGPIRDGWMLIDFYENPIGWCPDGVECPDHEQQFEFRAGPYGRMCAYPVRIEVPHAT